MATRMQPESTQRFAIFAAAVAPLVLSLQLFFALFFPLAGSSPAWAQDAWILLFCEAILLQAGFLSAFFTDWRTESASQKAMLAAGLLAVAGVYGVFLYFFSTLARNPWIVANVGFIVAVRLVSAPFDGAQGAAERFSRGLMIVVVFGVLFAAPVLNARHFPSFGITPGVYAVLEPGLGEVTRSMAGNAGSLARAVLLCAVLYLMGAVVELLRLGTVFKEESAPALGVAEESLAIRPQGSELTVAQVGRYAFGLLSIAFCVALFAPSYFALTVLYHRRADQLGDAMMQFLFGLILVWPGFLCIRHGLRQIFSRAVFRVRKGEVVVEEWPALGPPAQRRCSGDLAGALTVKTIYGKAVNANTQPLYSVALTFAGRETAITETPLDSRSEAEGLRKLMLAYGMGIEQASVRKSLRDDTDVRQLLGKETLFTE